MIGIKVEISFMGAILTLEKSSSRHSVGGGRAKSRIWSLRVVDLGTRRCTMSEERATPKTNARGNPFLAYSL